MFNLGTVIKFEVIRAIKKPSFWLSILSFPVIYGALFGLGTISGKQAKENQEKLEKQTFSFEITDESKIINPKMIEAMNGKNSQNREKSIEKVKNKEIDAYFFVPKDFEKDKVEIFGVHTGFGENSKYDAVLSSILKNSSIETVDSKKIAAINNTYLTEVVFFRDGKEYNPSGEMIAPGIFLAVFYLVIILLSNRMLTSTTEEKENRVTEMILTSISAKTLIVGKIISLVILGIIQILTILVPMIVGYFVLKNLLNTPDFISVVLGQINLDPIRIATSAIILIAGFAMITGFTVAIGAAMPTAQEAGGWFGTIMMFLMSPFFVISMFFAAEKSIVVDVMSYFPLTSPIALLLRNTIGTLSTLDAIIGVGILVVSSIITIILAIRIFQFGTLSYGKKVSLKSLWQSAKSKY